MKRDFPKVLGIKTPPDGMTDEEKVITNLLCNAVVDEIYTKLPTSRMKAIVAMHFELGYDQETLGRIFKVKQEQIALDIKNIKKVLLGKPYKPHKRKLKVSVEDLLSMAIMLKDHEQGTYL